MAGATGFVGRALVPALAERCDVVALGRRAPAEASAAGGAVVWRRCDLFSLRETESALAGAQVAYYLVHSMMPSARLTQGRFEDLDVLLADNFARAAAAAGVERIVYLGGIVPSGRDAALSAHLASRVETERVLAGHGVPVTAVRSSLVVGAGGSSHQMLMRLVERLPVMICPRWTLTRAQPIALDDLVPLLVHCLDDPEARGRVCEVGGPDALSYREMMGVAARVMGRRRLMLPVPLFSPGLSRLWVSLVTGAPRELAAPLVQSLRHPMLVQDPWLQKKVGLPGRPFARALEETLRREAPRATPTARSVQRLPLPPGRGADWIAHEYFRWLPRFFRPFLRVEQDGERIRFEMAGVRRPLLVLELRPERSSRDRSMLAVVGGLLAGAPVGTPRLEFRTFAECGSVLAAVQDFPPRLPWWLYTVTQARIHVLVMKAFGRHLGRLARAG